MFNHGIVAGKFYPLHLGHDYLIRKALEQSHRLTIFVVYKAGETPDGDVRVQWLKEAYPTANVRKVCDMCTDDSTEESNIQWAEYTRHILENDVPDTVFSSEQYAIGWAKQLGATHVTVDAPRSMYAISGTQIRKDPYFYWHLIHPVARRSYVKKVLVVGAESTGKSTLAIRLSRLYGTFFVPEYGRIYVEKHGINDRIKRIIFPEIVNEQQRLEDELTTQANRVILCDTDLFTTWLWYNVWQPDNVDDTLGKTILEEATNRTETYDLVLVSDDKDTEWVDDGFRDQKDTRAWFTRQLLSHNIGRKKNTVLLTGTWQQRENRAIAEINKLFGTTEATLPQERS